MPTERKAESSMFYEELSERSHSKLNMLKFQCAMIFLRGHFMVVKAKAVLRDQLRVSSMKLVKLAMNSFQY